MFGKTDVFGDGVTFAVVTTDTLVVRVDEMNRGASKEAASFRSLSYMKSDDRDGPPVITRTRVGRAEVGVGRCHGQAPGTANRRRVPRGRHLLTDASFSRR
jgi:hypothetical protein